MDLDELAQQMNFVRNSLAHFAAHVHTEANRSSAKAAQAQVIAAKAEERAAEASIQTADATIAAISALATAVSAHYSYWNVVKIEPGPSLSTFKTRPFTSKETAAGAAAAVALIPSDRESLNAASIWFFSDVLKPNRTASPRSMSEIASTPT